MTDVMITLLQQPWRSTYLHVIIFSSAHAIS